MNRLQQIEARQAEIRALLEGTGEIDLASLETEIRALQTERDQIEQRAKLAAGILPANVVSIPNPESRSIEPVGTTSQEKRAASEKRGKDLKENRAVTVGSAGILLPEHQASDIRPTFNEVSGLLDRVSTKPLPGGESYQQSYVKGYGIGDNTAENADYATAEPVFGYADINKSKVTAYAEDSEEIQKLPAADYDAEVMKGITIASRKKITREILIGDGATNHLAGIFSAAATAIDAATDKSVASIDETTLDDIVYSFGGDEDVEDVAVLILNKKDLKAFATLRSDDGLKIYDVKTNGNTGTIDSVPFIINSACKAISDPATSTGEFSMAYGPLSNYLLTVFSDVDVQRSTDFKFKQGMIAHRSSVFVGGNVVSKNGFLRVKKG
jgi:HK97 family phage major capsid protein